MSVAQTVHMRTSHKSSRGNQWEGNVIKTKREISEGGTMGKQDIGRREHWLQGSLRHKLDTISLWTYQAESSGLNHSLEVHTNNTLPALKREHSFCSIYSFLLGSYFFFCSILIFMLPPSSSSSSTQTLSGPHKLEVQARGENLSSPSVQRTPGVLLLWAKPLSFYPGAIDGRCRRGCLSFVLSEQQEEEGPWRGETRGEDSDWHPEKEKEKETEGEHLVPERRNNFTYNSAHILIAAFRFHQTSCEPDTCDVRDQWWDKVMWKAHSLQRNDSVW